MHKQLTIYYLSQTPNITIHLSPIAVCFGNLLGFATK